MPADNGYDPRALVSAVLARGLEPPPAVDLAQWAIRNVRFGAESPFPGPYDPARFPFYRRPLECLSPDHPARVVVLRGSAQIGKSVLAQIFLGATEDLDPGPFMYVHPTEPNARRWVRTKWWPMVRASRALSRVFESRSSKEGGTSLEIQETKDGRGVLIVSGANSASSLSMASARRQVQDDLSKWADLPEGDPEGLADDRSKAFAWGKIFKVSTPHLAHKCRISDAFARGTQEQFHVPCPHCDYRHPFDWDQFRARAEENPTDAFFVCPDCGSVIEEKHRAAIVAAGEWIAHNPNPEPGWVSFDLWAAYAGLESWATLARVWHAAKGDPADEQRVTNTTGGKPYEQPGEAPAWEELRTRAEKGQRPRGLVPFGAILLTLTLDCQDDYVDGVVVGWGRDLRRWVIDRVRIEGHISMPEARAELHALVERTWATAAGARRRVDLVGIDANAWTDDVFDWTKAYSKNRVIMVRGVGGDAAPTLALVRKERRRDGRVLKYQGRFFNVGVNGLKGALYKFLRVNDPDTRGYVDFPAGLEDDYYEQLTAEKRMPVVDRRGFTSYQWTKARGQRNEQLDCMVYAEALAGKLGWRTLTPAQWAALEHEREIAGAHPASSQADLFRTVEKPAPTRPEPIVSLGAGKSAPLSDVVGRPAAPPSASSRSLGALLP